MSNSEIKGEICPECKQHFNSTEEMQFHYVIKHVSTRPDPTIPTKEETTRAALRAVSLLEGEKIIETLTMQCEEIREITTTSLVVFQNTQDVKHYSSGYLFLTTDRIIFVIERGGLNVNYQSKFGIPYEEIISLRTGKYRHSVSFVEITNQLGGMFRLIPGQYKESYLNPELKLAAKIKELSLNKMARIEKEKKGKGTQIVLDFSFLRPLAEKGMNLQAIKCPHCGGIVKDLPATGSLFNCAYCGSTIYANDIYKEISRLLGYTVDQIQSQSDFVDKNG
jgi:hypothetical protein